MKLRGEARMLPELDVGCWSSTGAGLQSEVINIQVVFHCGRGWGTAVGPVAEEPHYLEVSTGGGPCKETSEEKKSRKDSLRSLFATRRR